MKYQPPEIIASYSLNAALATAKASGTFSEYGLNPIPNGDVYFLGSGYNGYLSSVMYSNGTASGHYHGF